MISTKKLKIFIIIPLIIGIITSIIMQILFHILIPKSEHFNILLKFIYNNNTIKNQIGDIIKVKMPLIIPFEFNPGNKEGYAAYTIKIIGTKTNGKVIAKFEKCSKWFIRKAVLRVNKKEYFLISNEKK